jgi:TfoX/Sxy family transcriptional regulator of competence genes
MAAKRSPVSKWKPASDAWMKALQAALSGDSASSSEKMFGYPAAFVGGNMAAGLHQDGLVLRLETLIVKSSCGSAANPSSRCPDGSCGVFALAPQAFASSPNELRAWLERSIRYAASLPRKDPAAKRKRAARKP